jgi:hypothetical protein
MVKRMEEQANLQKRVEMQLQTLTNLWDAATGTFTNTMAAFAETFAPEIKALTEWFTNLAQAVGDFSKEHPKLSKFIGIAVGGFALVATSLGAMAIAFAGAMRYVALVATLNPIGLVVAAFAAAALLVITNWETVKGWFVSFFNLIGEKAQAIGRFIPDWLKGPSWRQAPSLAPSVAPASRGQIGGNFGGTLNIKVDGPARVTGMKTNDSRFGFNVDAGLTMAGAY